MKEAKWRSVVVDLLRPLCAFSVENTCLPGTPDVCTSVGWVELKLGHFPARSETIVGIDMREAQRVWHARWARHGGASWVLSMIDNSCLLHPGKWSAEHLGRVNRVTLTEAAICSWYGNPPAKELIHVLLAHRKTLK